MAYTTEDIVRAQSPFKNSTNIETGYITRKIGEADSIINSYIGLTYQLPIPSTPKIIQAISETLAVLLIFREQNPNIEIANGVNIDDTWSAQMELLDQISKGRYKLFDDTTGIELPLVDAKRLGFYPNQASSELGSSDSTAPQFTMNMTF